MAALTLEDDYRDVRPLVPARPTLWSMSGTAPLAIPVSAITDLPHVAWFSNGRSAIAHAAMLAGVAPGSTVLMPAYHCESMIAPFAWLGAKIRLYRIRQNLEIDVDHLQAIADEKTRLVLYPQYFGHRRSAQVVHRLSKSKGWTLVEDCAHAFFDLGNQDDLGIDADFVVASPSKFLPAFDGGVLASRQTFSLSSTISRPRFINEVQALVDSLEYAFSYGRLRIPARIATQVFALLRHLHRATMHAQRPSMPASRFGSAEFEPNYIYLGATILARCLAKCTDRASVAAARRNNWQVLRDRLARSPRLSFPIDTLSPNDVPYALAIEVQQPDRVFPELKRRGVPAYRWETSFPGCEGDDCEISQKFRQSLIQIPCHQSLTETEREWIASTVESIA